MEAKSYWMVIVRWPSGRGKMPAAGHAIPHKNVTETDARRIAGEMQAKLPNGVSTKYSAEPMPSYLR